MVDASGRERAALPSGTVTFLLSDAEASSVLWRRGLQAADEAFAQLGILVARVVDRSGGSTPGSRSFETATTSALS